MSEDPYQSTDLDVLPQSKESRISRITAISRKTFWITFILGLTLGMFLPLLGYYIPSDGSAKAAAQTLRLEVGLMIANGIFFAAVPSGLIAVVSAAVCAIQKRR